MTAIVGCSCDDVRGCHLWKLSPRCFHFEAVSSITVKTAEKAGSGTSMLFHHLVLDDVSADGTVVKRDGLGPLAELSLTEDQTTELSNWCTGDAQQ